MRSISGVVALAVVVSGGVLGAQSQVFKVGEGVKAPMLVKEVKPVYTEDAIRRRVQGTVLTSCVILADGTVGDVTVTRSLDPELDPQAVKAVKQWQFKPGTKDGAPVPVQVAIELTFTLRDGPSFYKVGPGIVAPVIAKEVKPDYPDSAKQAGVHGTVQMEGVVEVDGTITGIRVTRSVDERLDQSAVKALGQWRFKPGQKDGKDVRVQVNIEMSFNVR